MDSVQNFSIKDLEHLSGVKAHTIRAWEQRYGILNAKRTATNIRKYSGDDLKLLLNIAILNKNGFKISKIAVMDAVAISKNVLELSTQSAEADGLMDALLVSMIELDEYMFDQVTNRSILQKGLEKTMLELIFPFLKRVGILWSTGGISPIHEHFATNIIRQKLIVAIDGQNKQVAEDAPHVLLFLPEGEFHELSLLFLNYMLRNRKLRVTYLGANIPFEDLEMVVSSKATSCMHTIVTSPVQGKSLPAYLDRLAEVLIDVPLTVSGLQVAELDELELPENCCVLKDEHEVLDWISSFV